MPPQPAPGGQPKYVGLRAAGNGLFNYADQVLLALICEGEIDAMTVWQEASSLVLAVATGEIQNAHLARWVARLACLPLVLIAFDTDAAGEPAAQWWLVRLQNAVIWSPICYDINDMLLGGKDVRRWIEDEPINGRKSNRTAADLAFRRTYGLTLDVKCCSSHRYVSTTNCEVEQEPV